MGNMKDLEVSGALQGNCRRIHSKTSFSPVWVFSFVDWGVILWYLWVGRARHPGPRSLGVSVELFNVGGWLTHGDFALEAGADFLAVVEHRLILQGCVVSVVFLTFRKSRRR